MNAPAGGFWPTENQEILLRAILLEGRESGACWEQWKACTRFHDEYLDRGSFRLLPLLYKVVAARSEDDEYLPKLKGIYRQTWARNQVLFAALRQASEVLSGGVSEFLVLKGADLTDRYYRDRGARPMTDLDVAVRPEEARAAIDRMVAAGWRVRSPASLASDLEFRHSCSLVSPDGVEIDLHWHILSECCRDGLDEMLWARAVEFDHVNPQARALDPTGALFHTVVHGTRWNPVPPLRWIADAMVIVRTSPDALDWRRLLRHADDAQCVLRLQLALSYLVDRFRAPIPAEAMRAIRAARPSALERVEYRFIGDRDSWSGVNLSSLVLSGTHCARATRGEPVARRFGYSARYMRRRLRGKRVLRRLLMKPLGAPRS